MDSYFDISLCLNSFFLLIQTFEYLELKDKLKYFFKHQTLFFQSLILRIILILLIPFSLILFPSITPFLILLLIIIQFTYFYHFNGPFNGGSDYISTLILMGLFFINIFQENSKLVDYIALYISIQIIFSYFLPGVYKMFNASWLKGNALENISRSPNFKINSYLKGFLNKKPQSKIFGYLVIILEVLFPILIFIAPLWLLLPVFIFFHLLNYFLFGLNRFIFAWIQAYPFLLWFKNYIILKYNF